MNPEVQNYLFSCIAYWVDEFDIDGIRLDAADYMDRNFFRSLRSFCDSKKELWLMGEVIHGDYKLWANENMLDTTTNYECYKGIYSSHNDKNYFEIAYAINRQNGDYAIYKDLDLYNFVDNHDVDRIVNKLNKKEYLENVYTLLFTMPGIPSIYNGSEWGIEGIKHNNTDEDLRPDLNLGNIVSDNKEIFDHIKRLGTIRNKSKALRRGQYKQIVIRNEQYAFKRFLNDESIYVLLNLSENPSLLEFEVKDRECLKDELTGDVIKVQNNKVTILLKPFKGMILK